jgi:hypothetical protein
MRVGCPRDPARTTLLLLELDIFESPDGTRNKAFATTHYASNNLQKSTPYLATSASRVSG